MANQARFPVSHLKDKKALVFAGIGNPDHFRSTLAHLNVHVTDFIVFKDHHAYSEKELVRIIRKAEQAGADCLVTTEKDGVKLYSYHKCVVPVYYLKMDLEIVDGIESLQHVLNHVLKKQHAKGERW